ncbi:MAG: hypothetical protein V1831_04595 [Candidatus Woesearchaeota archaeon]
MKDIKLKKLEKSFDDGVISKKEYEKKKNEIEEMLDEKVEAKDEVVEEAKLKSDRILIIGVILVVVSFAIIFSLGLFTQKVPETLDELHAWNLKGKLKDTQGYLYSGYSFVRFDNSWYTQLMSPGGSRFYNIQFRYGPKEVESVNIGGLLDTKLFNSAEDYYVTFNPKGNEFSYVAAAIGDFNQHMTSVFFKKPIAACDRNETKICKDRPIITCENTDKVVLYVKEANITRVYYNNNCIVIEGSGFELVKGVDRVLFDFYKILGQ